MSIRRSMKWLALAGVGVLVSGCVAAPTAYSPGNVAYSDTVPGKFVADPAYGGGGYYEVIEVYEDPYYDVDPYSVSYGADPYYPAPYYGTVGTSLFLHSHGSRRHRHDGGHKSHSKHSDKPKRIERNRGRVFNQRNLTPEEIVARDQRQAVCRSEGFRNCREKRDANNARAATSTRAAEVEARNQRQAACRAEGFQNCREKRQANRRATTENNATVARNETQRERRAARQAACREAGFANCQAQRRADSRAAQRTADPSNTRRARDRRIRPASGRQRSQRDK